jgi:hypothetical protein
MIEAVYEFHKLAGTPIGRGFNRPLVEQTLRHLAEELGEAGLALAQTLPSYTSKPDDRHQAYLDLVDAFVDLGYVATQGLIACGLSEHQARDVFWLVHDANMDKIPLCEACGGLGYDGGPDSDGTGCSVCGGSGFGPPLRSTDPAILGKILKPASWLPPEPHPQLTLEFFEPVVRPAE